MFALISSVVQNVLLLNIAFSFKEIWFRFIDEIVYSVTIKLLIHLFILKHKEKKRKEKREKNGFDLGSPGLYYGKNTNLITCINSLSYHQY